MSACHIIVEFERFYTVVDRSLSPQNWPDSDLVTSKVVDCRKHPSRQAQWRYAMDVWHASRTNHYMDSILSKEKAITC